MTMTPPWPRACLWLAGSLSVLTFTASAAAPGTEVVYDSTPNRSDAWVSARLPASGRLVQIGDEITLAGSARIMTQFVFEYFGDFKAGENPGANAVVRFFANDGAAYFENGVQRGTMPGSLLWESQAIQVSKEFNQVTLTTPNIVVPDKVTWTIQFDNISVGDVGLTISTPVVIGGKLPTSNGGTVIGSYADYWAKADPLNASSWALYNVFPNRANFDARITAVPEPGTIALFSVAGVFVLLAARRSRA